MPTITLKNVPAALHARLKEAAEANHRSLNREAIRRLEQSLDEPVDKRALMERIRARREEMAARGAWLTDEFLERAIEEGRP